MNSNGDKGVLTGKWQEPYSDGFAPYRWTGSVPILREWSKAGGRAVKYGQCWVFAGVACTGEAFMGVKVLCTYLTEDSTSVLLLVWRIIV